MLKLIYHWCVNLWQLQHHSAIQSWWNVDHLLWLIYNWYFNLWQRAGRMSRGRARTCRASRWSWLAVLQPPNINDTRTSRSRSTKLTAVVTLSQVTTQLPNVNDTANSELLAVFTAVASDTAPKHQWYTKINSSSILNSELGYQGNVNASSISTEFMKSWCFILIGKLGYQGNVIVPSILTSLLIKGCCYVDSMLTKYWCVNYIDIIVDKGLLLCWFNVN